MSDQDDQDFRAEEEETEQHDEDGEGLEEEDDFINNHDLIGVEGIILAQKNEIE